MIYQINKEGKVVHEYTSLKEASAYLKQPITTLRIHIKEGRVLNKHFYLSTSPFIEDVERLIESRTSKPEGNHKRKSRPSFDDEDDDLTEIEGALAFLRNLTS